MNPGSIRELGLASPPPPNGVIFNTLSSAEHINSSQSMRKHLPSRGSEPSAFVAQAVQPGIPEPTEHTFSGHRLSILLTQCSSFDQLRLVFVPG